MEQSIKLLSQISLMKIFEYHAYSYNTTMEEINEKLSVKLDTYEFYQLLINDQIDYDDLYYRKSSSR